MQIRTGEEILGFRVTRAEYREELKGKAVSMEHIGTGAKLFWLDNKAENKVFGIAFRTLPEDDTGVFHILEHSVLCGSGKYPVREPFVELLKSSMSTFLNAVTFPDMTLYPVGSRNNRDLLNLTEVYLDAVFDPACRREEKIFRQEGWHIETDENGNPVYKGVVFNEMKGAMSDVDGLIEEAIARQLFPDTAYGFNSGGDPDKIPELTYEQFVRTYERYYHPSNARIYLDGDVPMEEMLSLIGRYLARFKRQENLPAFIWQTPKASESIISYELGAEETAENKGHYTVSRLTGTWRDRAENMARGIIADVLTGSNEAPLKRAALEKGLCQDLTLTVDDTGLQSWVTLHAERVTDGKEAEIEALVREHGEKILRDGIDSDAAEASLNRAVYHLREEEEPQGIGRCIRCMGTWLYGGEPELALESAGMIAELRGMLANGRLNALAADMLLNREGAVVVRAVPSRTAGAEAREREAAALRRITASWTAEKREENRRMLETLDSWQQTPDSDEALETLPALSLADADVAPDWTETEETLTDGIRTLVHRISCNGVVHIRAYFNLTDCSLEDLSTAAGLSGLLGRMPTANHDAWSLQQDIKRYTGSLGFSVLTRSKPNQAETCTPYLAAYASALCEHADKAQALLSEILMTTRLEDDGKITEILRQTEMGVRQRVIGAGHAIGVRNVLSHYSAENAARDALEGGRMVRLVHQLTKEPEKTVPAFREKLQNILKNAVCRKRMILSFTGDEPVSLMPLIRDIPEGMPAPEAVAYCSDGPMRTGYRIPAQIGFAVRGSRLSEYGVSFTGSAWLATQIISLGYLWNKVRVQGGAYGAGISLDRAGNVFTYSFRDPTPARTLTMDAGISAFLRDLADCGADLDKYIISSLNELNPLLSPREKGVQADMRTLTGYTRNEAERIRLEVLHATPEQLAACGSWLDAFAKDGAVCVVAHEDALKACDGLEISDL